MATYVLVHGAWHGGWCWKKVAPLLRHAGHEVFIPTLTGLGERAHLLTPEVDLTTHVQDIVGVLTYEDLQEVILVGHSYGGMVISGVAQQAALRLSHLVYLDAFVPENGRCLLDYAVPERAARMRAEGERTGFVTPPPMSLWGLSRPEHLAFVGPRAVIRRFDRRCAPPPAIAPGGARISRSCRHARRRDRPRSRPDAPCGSASASATSPDWLRRRCD